MAVMNERRRCRSMPTQRVPLSTVGPPLELSGRAAEFRAVTRLHFGTEDRPPARERTPRPPKPTGPFMTSSHGGRLFRVHALPVSDQSAVGEFCLGGDL